MPARRRQAVYKELRVTRPLGARNIVPVGAARGGVVLRSERVTSLRPDLNSALHVWRHMEAWVCWKHQCRQRAVGRPETRGFDVLAARRRSRRWQQLVPFTGITRTRRT